MSWAVVAGAGVSLVGGLMGGQESGSQQTSQQSLDPRMQSLLYGDGTAGNTGMLNDVNNLRKQQMANGGLNPMQTAGLEMQRQTLMDPRYSQGYDQMRQQGSSLMSQGVAGNPFSQGYQGGTNFSPNLGMTGGQQGQQSAQSYQTAAQQPLYQQNAAMQGAMQPFSPLAPYKPPEPAETPATTPLDDYMRQLEEEQRRRDYEERTQGSA